MAPASRHHEAPVPGELGRRAGPHRSRCGPALPGAPPKGAPDVSGSKATPPAGVARVVTCPSWSLVVGAVTCQRHGAQLAPLLTPRRFAHTEPLPHPVSAPGSGPD